MGGRQVDVPLGSWTTGKMDDPSRKVTHIVMPEHYVFQARQQGCSIHVIMGAFFSEEAARVEALRRGFTEGQFTITFDPKLKKAAA